MRRPFPWLCPTIVIAFLLLLAVAGSTAGDSYEVAGTYDVTGVNPDGSAYGGTVEIVEVGQRLYHLKWNLGDDSYEGQGALLWGELFVVWGQGGADCRAFFYEMAEDGTLSGDWFSAEDVERRGSEEARPVGRRTVGTVEGRYEVVGTDSSGTAYKTELFVSTLGSRYYEFQWNGPQVTLKGIGELDEDSLVVVQKDVGQCGRMTYDIKDGGRLEGTWKMTDNLYETSGSETAVRRGRSTGGGGVSVSAVD